MYTILYAYKNKNQWRNDGKMKNHIDVYMVFWPLNIWALLRVSFLCGTIIKWNKNINYNLKIKMDLLLRLAVSIVVILVVGFFWSHRTHTYIYVHLRSVFFFFRLSICAFHQINNDRMCVCTGILVWCIKKILYVCVQ